MRDMHRADLNAPDFSYDDEDPPGYRAGMARFGTGFGAEDSGTTLYEIPPGEALCPYHYEYGEEEWALVLEGECTVRTTDGTETLGPLQLAFFPKGPAGAHQLRNDADVPLRVLMWSTVVVPTATAYPDSGKVGIWTGIREEDVMVERSSAVPYYHGEAS